jgi:hypothetical protein
MNVLRDDLSICQNFSKVAALFQVRTLYRHRIPVGLKGKEPI